MGLVQPQDLISKFKYSLDNAWGYIWGAAGVMWTEAKQKNATREQTVKYGAQWIGHMVADCSGLFKWAFRQLGGDIYHGSNTMYLKYCTRKGKLKSGQRTDGKELKPGTAVFVWNAEDQKYGHVGLYVGDGLVIEAAGTRQGVIQGKVSNSKWTNWGELKGVDYSGAGGDTPGGDPQKPTLRKGDKGEAVKELQERLITLGYDLGSWGADGNFGKATETAVKAFQKDHGLVADGIVGKKTWAALDATDGGVDEKPDDGGNQDDIGDADKTNLYRVVIAGLTLAEAKNIVAAYPNAIIERM